MNDHPPRLHSHPRTPAGPLARPAGCEDSQLSLLLRYLLLLFRHQNHSGFHPYWWPELSPPTSRLAATLLLRRSDPLPPAAMLEAAGDETPALRGALPASGVTEQDVQVGGRSYGWAALCVRSVAAHLMVDERCWRRVVREERVLVKPAAVDVAAAAVPGAHLPACQLLLQALRTSLGCDREEAVALLR